jgi:hypothetical protein
MKKSLSALLWTLIFVALLLGIDQFFLHVPASISPHQAAQSFYVDFRTRLLALSVGEKQMGQRPPTASEPKVLTKPPSTSPKGQPGRVPLPDAAAAPAGEAVALRYIYVDQAGDLHFADSLQEIPSRYRAEARPMSR